MYPEKRDLRFTLTRHSTEPILLPDPARVIHRPRAPILWPEELWEIRGDVPNVVFSNANLRVGDMVYVYYSGADHAIGLATCAYADLLDYAQAG